MSITRVRSTVGPLPLAAVVGAFTVAASGATAEPMPAQPALTECVAPRCLGIEFSADLAAAMSSGEGVSIAELAQGLLARYPGDTPLVVQLLAARYQNGRLVRYRVSERQELTSGTDPAALGNLEAVEQAFRPTTERALRVTALPDGSIPVARIGMERMVGNLPATWLISEDEGGGLLGNVLPEDEDEAIAAAMEGAWGVLALLPERRELRALEETWSYAVLVPLDPVRR